MLVGALDGPGERRHIRALRGSEFMCDGNHHTKLRIKEDIPRAKRTCKINPLASLDRDYLPLLLKYFLHRPWQQ